MGILMSDKTKNDIDNNSDDTSVQIIEDLINNGYPITLYKLFTFILI